MAYVDCASCGGSGMADLGYIIAECGRCGGSGMELARDERGRFAAGPIAEGREVATVGGDIHAATYVGLECGNCTLSGGLPINDILGIIGIPPDTENTPHTIAAAVLGLDEADLRKRLAVGRRARLAQGMNYGEFGRLVSGPEFDRHDTRHADETSGAEALLAWLTRPEDDQ